MQSALSSPNIYSAAVTCILCTCSVYLLDYTSEVEVTSCVDCRIFIGKRLWVNQRMPSLHCWCRAIAIAQAWATCSLCSAVGVSCRRAGHRKLPPSLTAPCSAAAGQPLPAASH